MTQETLSLKVGLNIRLNGNVHPTVTVFEV